jgi:pimeloyl-ACP methyl ester carboxylesterase
MFLTNSSGVKIAFDDRGSGEPALLFLPGWCAPRWVFGDVMARCAPHRRVLLLDWRGHGESEAPSADFGVSELADDAVAVLEASGATSVIPVASAHSGWVALELQRRLGRRVEGIVSLEWFVLGLPPQFREALAGLQSPDRWRQVVDGMHQRWLNGAASPDLERFLRVGMSTGFPMWSRAGREIAAAFDREPVPFQAFERSGVPVLLLYSQPPDDSQLAAYQQLAGEHPWFSVQRLPSRTQFSMLEAPDAIAAAIERFIAHLEREASI